MALSNSEYLAHDILVLRNHAIQLRNAIKSGTITNQQILAELQTMDDFSLTMLKALTESDRTGDYKNTPD